MTITTTRRHIESPVQRAVAMLYASAGCSVWQNTVYGAKPRGVTPGIPDLRVKQPEWRLDFDHECKPEGRRQSEPQYRYMRECQQMGTVYVLGGVDSAIDFLAFLGIVKTRLADTAQFYPRDRWGMNVAEVIDGDSERFADDWYSSEAFGLALERYGYKAAR